MRSDCLATFWLNGRRIGSTENALIEHTFDVSDLLASEGVNTLAVRLESTIVAAAGYDYEPLMNAQRANWARLWIRKPAHCYGWDIMPRAVSAGLWRTVELVVREEHEITDLTFTTISAGAMQGDGGWSPARGGHLPGVRSGPGRHLDDTGGVGEVGL